MKNSTPLPIASIRLDGGTQPRAALDFAAVEDYAEAMGAGAKFPPVIVFHDGENYWLADGFHRVKAAYAAGSDTIECDVRQGTLEDAQWFSFSANKSNGLRRTNDDRQRAVKTALAHPRAVGLSDNQIARHCGVTQPMVAAWRKRLGLSSKDLKMATRTVTRGGQTYQQNTTNIGKRKSSAKQAPPSQAAPPSDVRDCERLDGLLQALDLISGCSAGPADLGRLVAARRDREQLISSMEKTREFLELCATEAKRAGSACAATDDPGEPQSQAGDDADHAAVGPTVA